MPLNLLLIKIKKAITAALFCFCCTAGYAQVMVLDATDRPIMPKEYENVFGTPYLYDDWVIGWVRLANGQEYRGIFLMYDMVADKIRFTYKDGKTQAFVDPIARFKVGEREFRKDLFPKGQPLAREFYEVLADGETKLLRRTSKKVLEEVQLAVATKKKTIHTVTGYALVTDNKLVKVKNDKKSLTKALGRHQQAASAFITANKLDMKEEKDMIKLIDFVNSLD